MVISDMNVYVIGYICHKGDVSLKNVDKLNIVMNSKVEKVRELLFHITNHLIYCFNHMCATSSPLTWPSN